MSDKLFSDLGLSAESLQAIARLGFEQPSPIQVEAIPHIMAGHDVVGQSQTGSGKTAAFALPAIERIDPKNRAVQVLILCNTRELAIQVSEEVHKLAHFKPGIRPLPIYGGQSYERQISGLRSGANLVIGTPGRVMDHMQRGTLRLDQIHTVILDEADEMLDMGFRDDIEVILKAMPAERQTVLFSATVPPPIQHLIRNYTRDAVRVQIEAKALTVPTVEQVYYEVDRRWKLEALTRLIELHNVTLGIIFCNTQRMVDELSEHLHAAGYSADALHGGMAQAARDRVMKKFRSGGLEFLVATDVAARGIDVDDIQVVFNYDLPYDVEDYVHRIGRTGRAGRSGLAITFVSGREFFLVRQIENFTRQRLRSGQIPSEGEIERAKENQLLQRVRTTLQSGEFPRRDHFIETLLEEGFDSVAIASASLHLLTGGAEPEAAKSEPKSMSAKPALPSGPAPAPALAAPRPAVSPIARPPAIAAPKAPAPPRPVIAPAPNGVDESGFQDGESTSAIGALPAVDRPAASATAPEPKVAKPAVAKAPVKRALAAPATMSAPPKPALRSSTWDRPAFSENRPPSVGRPAPVARPEPFRPGADRPAQRPMQEQRPPVDRQRERDPMRPSPEPLPEARPVEMTMMPVWLGVGQREKITPEEVITCIQGHTGLPASVVGGIEIHEEHTLVDVTGEHARGVVLKLKHGLFRGKPLRAKLANR